MNKLTMFVLAAVAAATVAIGALAAAPSASASHREGNCVWFGPPGHQILICP
jgi:hypothetical protein